MKKYRQMLAYGSMVFVLQILMLLIRATDFSMDSINNPMLYIYGKVNDSGSYKALDIDMWMINLILYGVMVIGKVSKYRNGNFYMIISRYKSFKSYYKMVYYQFVANTLCYQICLALGAICGLEFIRKTDFQITFHMQTFILAQTGMFLGNLFFGIIVVYVILRLNSLKLSIFIYPGIPILSFVAGMGLPACFSNFFPGNWLLLAKSSVLSEDGYNLAGVIVLEMLIFALVSIKLLKSKTDS